MRAEALFELLDAWHDRGWSRPLDRALAVFLHEQQPGADPLVLLSAALTSHQLGRGHICLDLAATLEDPETTLALSPEDEPGETPPPRPADLLAGISIHTWVQRLQQSPLVDTGEGATPLVLDAGRLYLRRYWQYARDVACGIRQRLETRFPAPANLAQRLDGLFARLRSPREQAKTDVHWQSVAAAMAVRSGFCIISGGPGTGKTTTVVQLLGLLQGLALEKNRKLRIRLAAPTGKAAARLTESIGTAADGLPQPVRDHIPTEVTTLHRLLGSRPDTRRFAYNRQNPLHTDLVVVDEASMVDMEMMAALLSALPVSARLILLGDKDQLASVEAGAVLGDLCRNAERAGYWPATAAWIAETTGYRLKDGEGPGTGLDQHIVLLRKSHRFGGDSGIGALARAVNAGDTRQVDGVWQQNFGDIARLSPTTIADDGFARLVLDGAPGGSPETPSGYRAFLQRVNGGPDGAETQWLQAVLDLFGRFQLLAAVRKGEWGVEGLNARVADILFQAGLIEATEGWYPGRPVLVTGNDYHLGLMNGDIGITLPVTDPDASPPKSLKVVFPMPDGTLKPVRPSRLGAVETVYAMTVHKAQGSEFEHTAMVLPERMSPVLTRELVYTGVTRARRRFTLVSPRPDLLAWAVGRRTHRASGLGEMLGQ